MNRSRDGGTVYKNNISRDDKFAKRHPLLHLLQAVTDFVKIDVGISFSSLLILLFLYAYHHSPTFFTLVLIIFFIVIVLHVYRHTAYRPTHS